MIIDDWRGQDEAQTGAALREYDADHYLIKEEKMPDGRFKRILKEKASGKVLQQIFDA